MEVTLNRNYSLSIRTNANYNADQTPSSNTSRLICIETQEKHEEIVYF
jgi:hypothetical protein